jgi:hemolysin activation/secretion protein
MKFPKIALTATTFLYASTAFAITPAEREQAVQQLQQNEQKQENLIKHLGREYERKQRERAKPEISLPQVPEATIAPGKCFDIKNIELSGAEILSQKEREKLIKPYLGTCMDIAAINKLMHEITNFYIGEGYVTTRLAIPQQDLKEGTLQLLVIEGKIEAIELNQNSTRDQWQVKSAFPFLIGKNLNLRDIEQGLDQINRLASSRATMQIVPGTKDGYSKIILNNQPEKANRGSLGYDNSGQDSTGKNKATASLERDNLFGIGDYWGLNFNQDTSAHSSERGSDIFSAQMSVPLGYWTFSANASHSEYVSTVHSTPQSFQTSGETDSATAKVERVLHRDQDSKTSGNFGLTVKNTTNFLEDVELAQGTRQLTILKIGADHTLRAAGGIWYAGIGYERGLDALGARSDADNLMADEQCAQFDKFSFDASIYRPFAIKEGSFAFRTAVSGQLSNDTLFSSEQLNIGDRYTVRGFQESGMAGDSGAYIRNELMWNAPQFSENKYVNNLVGGLQPYIALDGGTVKNHVSDGADYMSGWAVGVRNNSEWMSFDVAYSKAIRNPAFVNDESYEPYFSVSAKVGF